MAQSAAQPVAAEDVRISVRLSPQAKEAVDQIMQLGGFKTFQEAIRRAIGDELFLLQQQKEGWKILLRKGNEYRELVWANNPG
jgi:Arc/MetJ-type ribon-helix-helix transcriptional regulator